MPTTVARGQITITDLNDGISCYLTNDAVTLPCNSDGSGAVLTGATTDVVLVYAGVQKTPAIGTLVTVNCTAHVSGVTVTIDTVTADSGYVDIPISYNGIDYGKQRFNFAKAKQGATTTVLTLELPDGNTFQGNSGNPKKINVKLMSGTTDVTSSCTTKWYFNGTENTNLANLKSLDVYPSDVPSNLTIRVVARYNNTQYQHAVTILDLDDIYQVVISGKDKIKNSSENITLTAVVFRGTDQITDGFRCRWSDMSTTPPTVIYEGINTTGTLAERGVTITLTPSQINDKLDLLCELSVDTVEQQLNTTEQSYTPSYDSKAYSTAMSIALS
jgi:hypothetical protein